MNRILRYGVGAGVSNLLAAFTIAVSPLSMSASFLAAMLQRTLSRQWELEDVQFESPFRGFVRVTAIHFVVAITQEQILRAVSNATHQEFQLWITTIAEEFFDSMQNLLKRFQKRQITTNEQEQLLQCFLALLFTSEFQGTYYLRTAVTSMHEQISRDHSVEDPWELARVFMAGRHMIGASQRREQLRIYAQYWIVNIATPNLDQIVLVAFFMAASARLHWSFDMEADFNSNLPSDIEALGMLMTKSNFFTSREAAEWETEVRSLLSSHRRLPFTVESIPPKGGVEPSPWKDCHDTAAVTRAVSRDVVGLLQIFDVGDEGIKQHWTDEILGTVKFLELSGHVQPFMVVGLLAEIWSENQKDGDTLLDVILTGFLGMDLTTAKSRLARQDNRRAAKCLGQSTAGTS